MSENDARFSKLRFLVGPTLLTVTHLFLLIAFRSFGAKADRVHRYTALGGRGDIFGEHDHEHRIVQALAIAERTVSFHVSNILEKLNVASRVEAAMWAKDQGVVP